MRWKNPMTGDSRIVRKFAIFPIECTNADAAWLEWVNVYQTYANSRALTGWINRRFVSDEERESVQTAVKEE